VPHPTSIDTEGLDLPTDDLAAALRVDPNEWRAEIPQIRDWFERFGDKLPAQLWTELDTLTHRLHEEAHPTAEAATP
jgi:phosphoenolpyruvate carboxykinase (GTP)